VQYSLILHAIIPMRSSDHAHSDHDRQLAKIMAEVGSSTSKHTRWCLVGHSGQWLLGRCFWKEPFLMLGFLTHSLLQTAIPL